MKSVFVVAAFGLSMGLALPAEAQSAQPPSAEQQFTVLATDYNRLSQDINATITAYKQEIAVLTQQHDNLDAYLKACGDEKGCTQPVPGTAPKP